MPSSREGVTELHDLFSDHLEDTTLSSGHLSSLTRESPVKRSSNSVRCDPSQDKQFDSRILSGPMRVTSDSI